MFLPLANLLHHKLGTLLNALGIGIGLCMLITLSGLSRGSLYEVADRWESVDAELFACPEIWGRNITSLSGVGLPDRYGEKLQEKYPDLVERVIPVFLWQVKLGGQNHLATGVDPQDWPMLTGGKTLSKGRLFDPENRFGRWLESTLLEGRDHEEDTPLQISAEQLGDADRNGLELVIDDRLAHASRLTVGQKVQAAGQEFTIVGIVPSGGMSRVYLPRRTAQFLFGSGDITKSTLLLIRLQPGVDPDEAARTLKSFGMEIIQIRQYRHMLEEQFGIMFVYVDAVNAVALVIAFLFIMITLYTMVLQRTREIAILKSCGASKAFIVRQVLFESLLLTGLGMAVGAALSVLAARLIETYRPLLTVELSLYWMVTAMVVALVGAAVSAIYPAWRATRVDMLETLTLE